MKKIIPVAAAVLAMSASADNPVLSGVSWTQRSPRSVRIEYLLENDPAIVTLNVYTNGQRVSSGVFKTMTDPLVPPSVGVPVNCAVAAGSHVVEWNAYKDIPGLAFDNGEVTVELRAWSPADPPDYMLVDLANPSNTHYYASVDELPWPLAAGIGQTIPDDDPYRTTHMLMRRIPASGVKWRMGTSNPNDTNLSPASYRGHEPQHYVTLTNDYYMAVFETTQKQYKTWTGAYNASNFYNLDNYPDRDLRPVEMITYKTIRGAAVRSSVTASSAIGKLRRKARGIEFDLPLEAQWEFACRAGTDSFFNDGGNTSASVTGSDFIGWINGTPGCASQTHVVGLRPANAYGLYDMHGNVFEFVQDYYSTTVSSDPVIAPDGPASGNRHVLKGGGYDYAPGAATSSAGRPISYESTWTSAGFRLLAPIPAEVLP